MQRLKGKKVLIGALAVLACSGDPTGNEGTPTAIRVQPEVVFVTQGDSQPVIVTVIDEDGQVLESDITTSNVGAGIEVVHDPTFLALDNPNQIRRQSRFFVKGVDLVATSFTFNALGLTKDVSVTSVPGSLAATISNLTPALGDTISITAPEGTFFNESSVLTFGGAEPVVVSRDASTIVFIPFPNLTGPAVVSDVGVTSNPNIVFTLATPDTVRTDSITDIGGNVSPTAPALGGTVTVTLPPELRVVPESLVQSGVGADTIPRGVTIAGSEVRPRDITVSADSLTITFVPPPNTDSVVVVPGVIARRLPMYPLELSTTAKVTTPVVDSIPATVSSSTPAVNEAVTVTSTDANFTFNPDAAVIVGADASPVVLSVAGDGSSISFLPRPGASGNVSVNGVDVAGFALTLPAQAPPITVAAEVPAMAGTGSTATAPIIAVPGPGEATSFFDDAVFSAADITPDGGVGAQYYQFTLLAETTFDLSLSSDNGAPDLDVIFCGDAACVTLTGFVATAAHDEAGEITLDAGTHYVAIVNFDGAAADWVNLTLSQ